MIAQLTQATNGALDTGQADALYDQVQARAAALTRLYSQLGARGEPAVRALGKLEVAYDAAWMARALGTGANYEDWFKPPEDTHYYAHPDSVGSLFSPASYLTTLYRAARPLHPPTHGLQLDRRRPDLRALKLTDTHLNQELSTLALTLEVLEAGVNDSDPNKDVDTKLREAVYPMTLPYNHATEQIRQGLAIKKTSAAEIWAALGDHEGAALKRTTDLSAWSARLNPSFVQDVLGVNPELYTMLTQAYVGYIVAGEYLGFKDTGQITDEIKLRAGLQLPTERVLEALGTGPYVDSISWSQTIEPASLVIEMETIDEPSSAEAGPFLVFELAPGGPLQLRFVSTVWLLGTETEDYDWSISRVSKDDDHAAGPALLASRSPRTREWRIDLGVTVAQLALSGGTGTWQLTLAVKTESWGRRDLRIQVSTRASLVSPQVYGARYLNGWVSSNPDYDTYPFYWYIGPQVGHPVPRPTNNPAESLLYHRHGYPYERLNRVVRLWQKCPLSFEELDWLIASTIPHITHMPLTRPMQALAVYLPLRERFGITVNDFVACVGPINTFHRPGVASLFEQRFGDPARVLGQILELQVAVDTHPAKAAARAALCQGLRIDDSTLRQLAVHLDGVAENAQEVVLTLDRVAALYRLVEIPRLWGLSVTEGLALWELLGNPGAIAKALGRARPTMEALDTIVRTGYLVDWLHDEELAPASLLLMTTRRYARVATPELQRFIENILNTLGRLSDTQDDTLVDLLCRHIGAECKLKANVATAMIRWLDAVAGQMNAELIGYTLLSFWRDLQTWSQGPARTLDGLERAQARVIQYVHLLDQFAMVCQWAQLTEQDLALVLPQAGKTSPLTGETRPPTLTLELLVLLSRYRHWQQQLVGPANEARRYLAQAAAGELNDTQAIETLAALHGWDTQQTRQALGATAAPRSFVALQPLLRRMQWAARLGLAPPELMMLEVLSEAGHAPSQSDLELIAAKVIAAAHV